MLEIITVDEDRRWDEIIQSMCEYDFYHLASYHRLDKSGKGLLIHFYTGTASFALPVILRDIEGTQYKDISSVYGYAGPLSRDKNPQAEDIRLFGEELKTFFDVHNIVTVFSRLHPMFKAQSSLLEGLGEVVDVNMTVGIDLDLPEADQKKQYARSLKYKINYLRKKGITVVKASSKKEVDVFIEMYKETMDRVNASKSYYFPPDYFYTILEKIDSCIFLAVYEGEYISGSLCTFCKGIMQAHLNATQNDFLYLSPLKLVLEQARIEGMKKGMNWLHLGGGKGGSNDSLFVFKSRFSDIRFMFKVWKYIFNEEVYNALIEEKFKKNLPETTFFPLYRK
jgi:lipid II:glycine glycyltransferase (peptidoglycan interpeptide bridge formation enzyme)